MRETLWIFLKDVRHLWPRILLANAWTAAMAAGDLLRPRHMDMGNLPTLISTFSFVATTYLIVSLLHEEKTVGEDRYWLTRPFPRGAILVAKLLFILAFTYVPTAIGNTVALTLNDYPPSFYWGPRAADVLFSIFTAAVATAAMAAVTSGMVQFVWATILWGLGWFATMVAAQSMDMAEWPGLEAFRADAVAAMLLILGAVVLGLMFTRRNRMASVPIVAASSILMVVVRLSVPWHAAFALKEQSSQHVDADIVQVVFNTAARPFKGAPSANVWPREGMIGVYLPVLLAGIPDGMQVIANRVAISIDGPRASWNSGWQRFGQLVPVDSTISDPLHPRISNGRHWFFFHVTGAAFERLSGHNVHLRARFAFTLFDRPFAVRIAQTDRGTPIPGTGFCAVLLWDRTMVPSCISPLEPPPQADLRWREAPDGPLNVTMLGPFVNGTGSAGIWQGGGSSGFRVWSFPPEVYLDIRRPIAWFERTLDIPAIRLADYH